MNTFRYDEEQRRLWVRQKHNKAKSVKQICKEASISRATLYLWIKEFAGVETVPVESDENDLNGNDYSAPIIPTLPAPESPAAHRMLQTALAKVDLDGSISRKLAGVLVKRFTISVAQACKIVGIPEEIYGYKPRKPEADDELVYAELTSLINEDRSRGFNQLYEILQKTRPEWPRKQIKRIYRERRLYLKRKRTRRSPADKFKELVQTNPLPARPDLSPADIPLRIQKPDGSWHLGMIAGSFSSGTDSNSRIWWLAYLLDAETGTPLNVRIGTGTPAAVDITSFLSLAVEQNSKPRKLKVLGTPPFNDKDVVKWVWQHKVALHTMSLQKEENMRESEQLEERLRKELPPESFADSAELMRAAESWLLSYIPQ
jgi:transposase InsO family protein